MAPPRNEQGASRGALSEDGGASSQCKMVGAPSGMDPKQPGRPPLPAAAKGKKRKRATTTTKSSTPATKSSTPAPSTSLPSPPGSVPDSYPVQNFTSNASIEPAHVVLDEMLQRSESYVNMMDDSVGLEDINLTQNECPLQITPLVKNKRSRTQNYSTLEDDALVRAWLSVGLDPIAGSDQSFTTYWNRISEKYHLLINSPRTISSLQHRWGIIATCCTRWAGCIVQVELNRPSGTTIQDEVPIAQEMYKQRDTKTHKNFTLFHCWQLLKDHEKWKSRKDEPATKKSKSSSSCMLDDNEDAEEEDDDAERGRSPTPSSRPPGRKQEKERLRKQDKGTVYKEVMQDILVAKKELEADKKRDKDEQWMALQVIEERKVAIKAEKWMALQAIKERKVAIDEEMLRIKKESEARLKNEQDEKIMFMDTSNLNETQRAYVDMKRSQILSSTMGFSLGADFNIGGGGSGGGIV